MEAYCCKALIFRNQSKFKSDCNKLKMHIVSNHLNKNKELKLKKTIEEIKYNSNKYFINPKGGRRERRKGQR